MLPGSKAFAEHGGSCPAAGPGETPQQLEDGIRELFREGESQHHNYLLLVLLGGTPPHKRASYPSQGIANCVVKVREENSPRWISERL